MGNGNKLYKQMSEVELLDALGKPTASAPELLNIQLMPALVPLSQLTEKVREAVSHLTKSSSRLETLTRWLIGLTVVLLLLTLILALPEFRKLFAWIRTR